MIKKLMVLGLLLSGPLAQAQNVLLENLEQKTQKNWFLRLSTTHLDGFGDSRVEPATVFGVGLSYTIKKNFYLDVSQRARKVYYVDFDTENEFKLSDPSISLRHHFEGKLFEGHPILSYGLTLPLSEYSRRNDVYTKIFASLSDSWMTLKNNLTITASVSGVYFVNGYTTTKTSYGSQGGSVLPQYDASASLSLSYSLGSALGFKGRVMKSLFLSGFGSYSRTTFESFDVAPVATTSFRNTDDSASLGASLAISPIKNLFASVGYGHNAEIENAGRVEYYLFDSLSTRWRLGLRYAYRF